MEAGGKQLYACRKKLEVKKAIDKLESGKAAGVDEITEEMLEYK